MSCPQCGSVSHPSANYCPQEDKRLPDIQFARAGLGNKRIDRELEAYAQTRREGSLPWGTTREKTEEAKRISDFTGRPFRADNLGDSLFPEQTKALRDWTEGEKKKILADHGKSDASVD